MKSWLELPTLWKEIFSAGLRAPWPPGLSVRSITFEIWTLRIHGMEQGRSTVSRRRTDIGTNGDVFVSSLVAPRKRSGDARGPVSRNLLSKYRMQSTIAQYETEWPRIFAYPLPTHLALTRLRNLQEAQCQLDTTW